MSSRDDQSNRFLSSDAINDDFFVDVIERKLNTTRDKFKLRLVFIAPATGKNENYVSVVYRAKISVEMIETKEKLFVNVIIKALLTLMIQMKEFAVFEREILMYQDVIESFEKIWSDATGEEAAFGPKCIKVVSDGYEIIVLDDLKPDGFEMIDRKIGVNLNQAKLVLSKLAKFHASSAIRYEKDGVISDHLDRMSIMKNEALTSPDEMQKSMIAFANFFKLLIEATHACGYSDIADKIARWDQMKVMMTFMSSAEPMKCGFKVLNHGDTWCNNFLFKNDADKNSIDMRFIDYQMSFWGSPVTDLGYFFISSLADDVKVENFDDLLMFYHEELVKALKTLNYEKHIPTLSELHIDLLEKAPTVAVFLMFIMFVAKFDSNEELNMEDVMDPEKVNIEVMRNAFMNGTYRNALSLWLPFLNKRGFFDTLLPEAPSTPFVAAILQQMQEMMKPPQDAGQVKLSTKNEATEE